MNNTTTESLLLYYFNETDLANTVSVQQAIDHDCVIRDEYNDIKNTFALIDHALTLPSEHSIQAILNYSRLTESLCKE